MYDTFMNFFFQNYMSQCPHAAPTIFLRYERGVYTGFFGCFVEPVPLAF